MVVYIGLILMMGLTTLLTSKFNEKDKKNIQFCIYFVMLGLIVILRSNNVGSDTYSYIRSFDRISNINWGDLNKYTMEPIYTFFNKLFSDMGFKAREFDNLYILVVLFLFLFAIYKYASNFNIGVIIYVCLCYNSIYLLRQSMSIAILFIAFKYVKERHFIKYVLCVLIAMGFHISAVLGIFVYFLYNIKNLRLLFFITITVAAGIYLLPDQIISFIHMILNGIGLPNKCVHFSRQEVSFNMIIILVITLLFSYLVGGKMREINIAFFAILIQLLTPITELAARLSLIYWPYIILVISNAYNTLSIESKNDLSDCKEIKIREILFVLFIGFYLFFWFYTLYTGSKNGGNFLPYKFFWEV